MRETEKRKHEAMSSSGRALSLTEIARIEDRQARARALWDHFGQLMMGLAKSYQASRNRASDEGR